MNQNVSPSDIEHLSQGLAALSKKLDVVIAIMLAQSGVDKKDVAKVIGISGRTLQDLIPFGQIKKRGN